MQSGVKIFFPGNNFKKIPPSRVGILLTLFMILCMYTYIHFLTLLTPLKKKKKKAKSLLVKVSPPGTKLAVSQSFSSWKYGGEKMETFGFAGTLCLQLH